MAGNQTAVFAGATMVYDLGLTAPRMCCCCIEYRQSLKAFMVLVQKRICVATGGYGCSWQA